MADTLSDSTVKGLLGVGLFVQGAAITLGFTSLGWRWPIAGATAVVALGFLLVQLFSAPPKDAFGLGLSTVAALALASAGCSAGSLSPPAVWSVRVFFGIELLCQILLMAFMLLFRMNRLW